MAKVDLLFTCQLSILEASLWKLGNILMAECNESECKTFSVLDLGPLKWSPGRLRYNNLFFQEVSVSNNQFWVSYKLIYSQVYFPQEIISYKITITFSI